MNDLTQSRWLPIVLLTCSNVFMTFAWYGHLKFKSKPLLLVIFVSWGIAFFEYCFQVPANRWGNSVYSASQLKIIQEVITLSVFVVFAIFYLGEKIRWNYSRRLCASWRRWDSPFCRRINRQARQDRHKKLTANGPGAACAQLNVVGARRLAGQSEAENLTRRRDAGAPRRCMRMEWLRHKPRWIYPIHPPSAVLPRSTNPWLKFFFSSLAVRWR